MAKQSCIQNNIRRKNMVKQFSNRRSYLKSLTKDRSLSPEDRFKAHLILAKLPRNSSVIRIRNRCEITGRARGYYRKFKMSRIVLREMASAGLIPGLTKSSW